MDTGGLSVDERYESADQPLGITVKRAEFHQGPLPTPSDLQAYEDVHPGFAGDIVKMAQDALAANIEAQTVPIRAEARALTITSISFALLPWGILLASIVLAALGLDAAAFVTATVSLLAIAPQIISAIRKRDNSDG